MTDQPTLQEIFELVQPDEARAAKERLLESMRKELAELAIGADLDQTNPYLDRESPTLVKYTENLQRRMRVLFYSIQHVEESLKAADTGVWPYLKSKRSGVKVEASE